MYKLALLGRDITYTRSPSVHSAIASALGAELEFTVVDVTLNELDGAVDKLFKSADGFFVTKPYKNEIKRYLHGSETACGVNLVRCSDRIGFNTDGCGFIRALDRSFIGWRDDVKNVLVLGAGGAAYSVAEALISAGKTVYVLNRTVMNAAKLCSALGAHLYVNQPVELAVNCTSVGLNGEDVLSSLCVLPDFKYAFDLIYSQVTPFLRRCGNAGASVSDGRDMLVYQAVEGDRILLDRVFDVEEIFEQVNKILCDQ